MSIPYLEAKMFKIEKCILNYACFKHPWSSYVIISEQLFLGSPLLPEHLQWALQRIAWTLITTDNFFNKIFLGKISSPQNCGEGREGVGGWHPLPPLSLWPCILNIIIWTINFILKSINWKQFPWKYSTWWSFWL